MIFNSCISDSFVGYDDINNCFSSLRLSKDSFKICKDNFFFVYSRADTNKSILIYIFSSSLKYEKSFFE